MTGRQRCRWRRLQGQRGITMIVALVLLIALGISAVWAFNLSTSNSRAVANTQYRQEALGAAQAAIDRTISSAQFVEQPQAVAAAPVAVDLSGDNVADYSVTLSPAPACYKVRIVKLAELDPDRAADRPCLKSSGAQHAGIEGISGSGAGDSLCADSEWNLRAEVADVATGTRVALNQGVALRGLQTDAANSCP